MDKMTGQIRVWVHGDSNPELPWEAGERKRHITGGLVLPTGALHLLLPSTPHATNMRLLPYHIHI